MILRVKDLRKACGAFAAADGVSFKVRRDGIFDLPGPDSAGKAAGRIETDAARRREMSSEASRLPILIKASDATDGVIYAEIVRGRRRPLAPNRRP